MHGLSIIWLIIQLVVGIHLVIPLLFYVLYSMRQAIRKRKGLLSRPKQADYGIIVTAYEDVANLHAVSDSLLKMNYSNYLIYIVADNCDVSSLNFQDEKVVLLTPQETLASNTRSHFYAIDRFRRAHERLTIIDSDNLVHPEYLNELNRVFDQGFEAVQGVRLAKNLDTPVACLDAARDIYYHFYDGKVLFGLGSSATLSGSGMAFSTTLYKACLERLDIRGAGFDKVLQAEIVKRGKRIAYAQEVKVFDEKTSRNDQLVNQRSRWINTWFKYFKYGFRIIGKGIVRFNLNQFLFGLVLLRPPLFMFLILSFVFMVLNIWMSSTMMLIWMTGFASFATAFSIALVKSGADGRIYNSLKDIPLFMFYQVISLSIMRKANERSVATRHFHKSRIEEI